MTEFFDTPRGFAPEVTAPLASPSSQPSSQPTGTHVPICMHTRAHLGVCEMHTHVWAHTRNAHMHTRARKFTHTRQNPLTGVKSNNTFPTLPTPFPCHYPAVQQHPPKPWREEILCLWEQPAFQNGTEENRKCQNSVHRDRINITSWDLYFSSQPKEDYITMRKINALIHGQNAFESTWLYVMFETCVLFVFRSFFQVPC